MSLMLVSVPCYTVLEFFVWQVNNSTPVCRKLRLFEYMSILVRKFQYP